MGWLGDIFGGKKTFADLMQAGSEQVAAGNYADAEKFYKKALEMAETVKHHNNVSESTFALAQLAEKQERYVVAEPLYRKAYQSWEDSEEFDAAANCLVALGGLYNKQRRLSDAEHTYATVLRIIQSQYGERHLKLGETAVLLAGCCLEQKSYGEADRLLSRALPIFSATFGEKDPGIAEIFYMQGKCQSGQDKYDAAEPLLAKAAEVYVQTASDKKAHHAHKVCACFHDLARCQIKLNKQAQADTSYKRAVELAQNFPGYLAEAELHQEHGSLARA